MARKYNTQNELEGYINSERGKVIGELMGAFSVEIRLYIPPEDDIYDDIYAEDSGIDLDESEYVEFTALFQMDAWTSAGYFASGSVESGHIYSDNENILPGRHFQIIRKVPDTNDPYSEVEELSAKYQVKEEVQVGKTRIAERKWHVMSLPD